MSFDKFERAMFKDREAFELSIFENDNTVSPTYRIPSDQDIEKRSTTVIERLFIDDLIKQCRQR